jgi:hypothetical protein
VVFGSTPTNFFNLALIQLLQLESQGHSLDPEQERRLGTIGGASHIVDSRIFVQNLIEQLLVLFQTLHGRVGQFGIKAHVSPPRQIVTGHTDRSCIRRENTVVAAAPQKNNPYSERQPI